VAMKAPVVATCPDCEQPGVLCCSACGKCAECALHDDCERHDESVHGAPDYGAED